MAIIWILRQSYQKNKKADTELKRLKKLAKEDWPASVQRAIRARLSKRYNRIIVLSILWGIFFMGLALVNIKLSEDSDIIYNELREARQEYIKILDESKEDLRLKTIKEPIDVGAKDKVITRWELICSLRANIEGDYKGQTDFRKIRIISNSYKACMLEQGWLTEQCIPNQQGCVDLNLVYTEGICIGQLREWLNGNDDIDEDFLYACTEKERKQLM